MRHALGTAIVVALLVGCTGTPPAVPRTTVSPPRPPSAPTPAATAESVTLVADLSDLPAEWEEIASIPFGSERAELGFIHDPAVAPTALLPRSFAIDGDGSIWILDAVKHRVAVFDRSGTFLRDVPIRLDDGVLERDIALTAAGVAVLEEVHRDAARIDSIIVFPAGSGPGQAVGPRSNGRALYVSLLVPPGVPPPGTAVVGDVHAFADLSGVPAAEFAEFAPDGGGLAAFLPGLPVGADAWANLSATSDQDFEIRFASGPRTVVQPIHVRVVPEPGGEDLPAIVGPGLEVPVPGGVGVLVELSPTRPRDASRYGGGRWYLQVSPDGDPLVWEPVPYGYHQQEQQVRHLTVGPDGRVYLMVLTPDGERILRRP